MPCHLFFVRVDECGLCYWRLRLGHGQAILYTLDGQRQPEPWCLLRELVCPSTDLGLGFRV